MSSFSPRRARCPRRSLTCAGGADEHQREEPSWAGHPPSCPFTLGVFCCGCFGGSSGLARAESGAALSAKEKNEGVTRQQRREARLLACCCRGLLVCTREKAKDFDEGQPAARHRRDVDQKGAVSGRALARAAQPEASRLDRAAIPPTSKGKPPHRAGRRGGNCMHPARPAFLSSCPELRFGFKSQPSLSSERPPHVGR